MKHTRMLAVLCGLAITMTLLPGVALAGGAQYWVGYTAITTASDASGEGWTWVADGNGSGTLTLRNAAIRGATAEADVTGSAVCLPDGSTVELQGDNTLLGGSVAQDDIAAICESAGLLCCGDLTITGSGNLTAVGGDTFTTATGNDVQAFSYGIKASSDAGAGITFDADFSGSVCAVGGYSLDSYGIMADSSGSAGATCTVAGAGTITATGGKARDASAGIWCKDLAVTGAAHITATGGEATAASSSSYGVASRGAVTVGAAAAITATGGTAATTNAGIAFGMSGDAGLTLSNGAQVTAIGGCAANSYGAYTPSQSAQVKAQSASVLTMVGGKATGASYGMKLGSDPGVGNTATVTVDVAALVAKGGSAPETYGLYASGASGSVVPSLGFGKNPADSAIVAHAGSGTGSKVAIDGFKTLPDDERLIGDAGGGYVVYGTGKYAEKDGGGKLTHVFDTAQTTAPVAPFVIIDGAATRPAPPQEYFCNALQASGDLHLSGTSVLIAGDIDTGAATESRALAAGDSLALSGTGTLVCLGGTGASSCGVKGTGSLSIGAEVNLTAVGGTAASGNNINISGASYGLLMTGGLSSVGNVAAIGGSGSASHGSSSAGLSLTSGALTGVGGQSIGISQGCNSSQPVVVSGASVSAVGGSSASSNSSKGMMGKLTSFSGSLHAVGGAAEDSIGLESSPTLSIGTVNDHASVSSVGGYGTSRSVGVSISDGDGNTSNNVSNAGLCAIGGTGGVSNAIALEGNGIRTLTVENTGLLTAFGGKSTATTPSSYGVSLNTDAKLILASSAVAFSGNTLAVDGGTTESVTPDTAIGIKAGINVTGKDAAHVTGTPDYITYKYLRTLRALTVSDLDANKAYDGVEEAAIDENCYTVNGKADGDEVTVTARSKFTSKDVGEYTGVSVTYNIIGKDAWKYAPPANVTVDASITLKELTIKDAKATDRKFDGTTNVAVAGGVLEGLVLLERLDLQATQPAGTMADASVGTAKSVTVTGYAVTGDADIKKNYTLTQPTDVKVNITQATPTITTPPTASAISYGQALSASTLSGGVATGVGGAELPGTFTWTNPSTTPPSVGSHSYQVTFTPTDATNYTTATCNVTVTVGAAVVPQVTGGTLAGDTKPEAGKPYSNQIAPTDQTGAAGVPASIDITVDGSKLVLGTDFTYNPLTGEFTIKADKITSTTARIVIEGSCPGMTVTEAITGGSVKQAVQPEFGTAYSNTIVPDDGRTLPASIKIRVNGVDLMGAAPQKLGTLFTQAVSHYTYDPSTGVYTIKAEYVSGPITVTALCPAAVQPTPTPADKTTPKTGDSAQALLLAVLALVAAGTLTGSMILRRKIAD